MPDTTWLDKLLGGSAVSIWGRAIDNASPPNDGDTLVYDGGTDTWGYAAGGGGGTLVGDVTGAIGANTVAALQNHALDFTSLSNGDVLTYDSTGGGTWKPVAPSGGGGFTAGTDLAGTSTHQTVVQITGAAGVCSVVANTQIEFAGSSSYVPLVTQDRAGSTLNILSGNSDIYKFRIGDNPATAGTMWSEAYISAATILNTVGTGGGNFIVATAATNFLTITDAGSTFGTLAVPTTINGGDLTLLSGGDVHIGGGVGTGYVDFTGQAMSNTATGGGGGGVTLPGTALGYLVMKCSGSLIKIPAYAN